MQLNRCPICHARISLDAVVQDEAGRELLGILAKLDGETGFALVGYLGLFRSVSRDLANDRALRLTKEALALSESLPALAEAMRITVEQIRGKGGDPLSNHRYLSKVLGDCHGFKTDIGSGKAIKDHIDSLTVYGSNKNTNTPKGTSKTAQALQSLKEFGDG
ncbi:hypothetical protein HC024_00300 [Methylococcaceae bacterium WWC4]|nr:hypothetical protein [Methylococcaceae bacterium WWC4]